MAVAGAPASGANYGDNPVDYVDPSGNFCLSKAAHKVVRDVI